jgi:hypothetical protein
MNEKKIKPEEFDQAVKLSGFSERDINICKSILIDEALAVDIASLYGIGTPRVSQIINKFQEFLPQESVPPGWREITVSLPVGVAGAVEQLSVTLKKEWESPNDS